jgi:hypothetical protein
MSARAVLLLSACLLPTPLPAAGPPSRTDARKERRIEKKIREVAGSAEYLRSVPKRFAILKGVEPGGRAVALLVEGDALAKLWPLAEDAEVKVAGWWGRAEQLTAGDRVWVWFQTDRKGRPVAVAMLADELSEQDIHGGSLVLEKVEKGSLVLKRLGEPRRRVSAERARVYRGDREARLADLPAGKPVYLQSAGGKARLVLDAAAFAARRAGQQAALRQRWLSEGLPGSVTFVHRFSGEMDLMLDHEAMRWGRSLKRGDKVTLASEEPITAVVKHVEPWRERTQVRLVAKSRDLTDLRPGQRLRLKMAAPPAEVASALLPPDLDRPRSRAERIEWFLASVYCTCGVTGDVCTGHFYTLASCNPNGCGMPQLMRKKVAGLIDKGLSDRQVFEGLLKEHGPALLRPHLRP